MDVFDAVRTVLAIREYLATPVPEDLVRRIVEAGRLTASSMNKQPWHFIVVDDPEMLGRIGESSRSGPYLATAPLAIAIVVDTRSRFAESDASRAAQSMVLTAWAEGVGSNWVGFHGLEKVGELLGVEAPYDVFAVLGFGYPTAAVGKGEKRRKPLSEIASKGRFGQPFE